MRIFFLLTFLLTGMVSNAQKIGIEDIVDNSAHSNLLTARFYDDKTIAFSGPDSIIYFIDLITLEISHKYEGLKGRCDAFAFSDDRKWMVASSIDNEVKTWKLKNGKVKSELGNYVPGYVSSKSIRFSPIKSKFSVYSNCDILIGKKFRKKYLDSIPTMPDECAYNIEFFDDGQMMFAAGNSYVWIYDVKSRKIEHSNKVASISVFNDLALSPDQTTLAVGGRDNMWLLNPDLSVKHELKGHSDWINDVHFSSDGKSLYSCSGTMFGEDNTIRIWDIQTGENLKVLDEHTNDVHNIDISSNGNILLSASRDKTIKIWDNNTHELIINIVPVKKGSESGLIYLTPEGLYYATKNVRDHIKLDFDGVKQLVNEIYNNEDMKYFEKATIDIFSKYTD